MLTHDFGILRPGTTGTFAFKIVNTTGDDWTIDHIERTCNCTAGAVSDKEIKSGGSASVTVSYRAPSTAADDERVVTVFFREAGTPKVRLVVKATVRPVMTLFPNDVDFFELLPGESADRSVMVLNYGEDDWNSFVVSNDTKWLTITTTPTSVESVSRAPSRQPRQAWRINLTASSAALAIGGYRAQVTFIAGNRTKNQAILPVAVEVPAPVQAIPDRIFFGYMDNKKPTVRTVILALSGGLSSRGSDTIQLTTTLAPHLQLSWGKSHGRFRHLKLLFDPVGLEGHIDGTIAVVLSGVTSEPLTIPISAIISQPAVVKPSTDLRR